MHSVSSNKIYRLVAYRKIILIYDYISTLSGKTQIFLYILY